MAKLDCVIRKSYVKKNKRKYFMVKGYDIHPHVVLTAKDQAGHLRDLMLKEGAMLYLLKK